MTCASCGSSFDCQLSASGCWCRAIPLTDEDRTRLRAEFADCLCRTCLEQAGEKAASIKGG